MENRNKVDEFKEGVLKKLKSATIDIDSDEDQKVSTWIDIEYRERIIVIEFRPQKGFGFYSDDAEAGEGPETIKADVVSAVEFAISRLSVKKKKKKKKK